MNFEHPFTALLVSAGAVFMASSIVVARRIARLMSGQLGRTWRWMTGLMYLFILGYILYIPALAVRSGALVHLTDFVVGIIFLGGAVFVFLVMRLTRSSLQTLREREDQVRKATGELWEKKEALEEEVRERQQAEQKLLEARNEWENTFNTIDEAITVHDLDYNILLSNRAAEQLLGPVLSEADGLKCFHAYHGSQQPPKDCPSCEVVRTAQPCETEFFEPHLDRHLNVKALPRRDAEGRMIGVVHVVRDISRLKEAQEQHSSLQAQFLQSQKLETVGRLAGGIAHDFNNLITVVMNYSEVLEMKLGPDHPGSAYLKTIVDTAEKAGNLTRQLLAFSRRQVLKMATFDLNEAVEGMMKILRRTIGEDIALDLRVHGRPVSVTADRMQIEQVLLNLVVNARDAMPLGGSLTVATGIFEPDDDFLDDHAGLLPGPYAMLKVIDTGEGMSSEVREKIFEPFFTTKKLGTGTGLGLATVYGIVKQHRGYVYADSVPGEGSTFTVLLSLAPESGPETTADRKKALPGGTESILLVDDESLVLESTREVLEALGYRVLPVSSGEDAVAVLQRGTEPVDLLLTDVVMKGMDGPELARQARVLRPSLRILYMSGYTGERLGAAGVLQEGAELIDKPLAPAVLAARLRELLDR